MVRPGIAGRCQPQRVMSGKRGLFAQIHAGLRRGQPSLYAAVYVFPVSHLHYEDEQSFIPNLINDAVVLPRPNIDAIELLLRLHLYHAMRAWILFELFYVGEDLSTDTQVQFLKLPERGRSELQGVE